MSDLPNVKGLAELAATFKNITDKTQKRVLRRGASAGSAYLKSVVQAAAPIGKGPKRRGGQTIQPGTLKRSAYRFFKRADSNANQAVFVVSFRQGKKQQKSNRDAYYAAWVERGHRIVPRKGKSGLKLSQRRRAPTGTVPPHPFFEQAVTGAAQRTAEVQVEAMTKEMQRVVSELVR